MILHKNQNEKKNDAQSLANLMLKNKIEKISILKRTKKPIEST
jgi:hypothetical protein